MVASKGERESANYPEKAKRQPNEQLFEVNYAGWSSGKASGS